MKKALITGVLGQDGSFLAEKLHSLDYQVFGVDIKKNNNDKLQWIKKAIPGIDISFENLIDKQSTIKLIENVHPDEIYNFAGYTNVFNPWENLNLVHDLNCKIPQNFLESIVLIDKKIKFFQASSCLIFGRTSTITQNEETPYAPIYPYGITKLYTDNLIKEFREIFGIYACSGIFFNHESERRGSNFFTKKITEGVAKISRLEQSKLLIGDLSAYKDMGYAKEFMDAVYLMMQNTTPKDYVIGTGILTNMKYFVDECFKAINLDWKKYVEFDSNLSRGASSNTLTADIKKIKKDLNWSPKFTILDIIKEMMDYELKKI